MKAFAIFTTLIIFSQVSFPQRMITDSTFYDNGKLKSYGKYDSLHKHWKYFGLYESGQVELTRILSPVNYWDIDTSIIYHRNGKVAWIFPYQNSGLLSGKLTGYYSDGAIKRESFYHRSFRTGSWKEYYTNGTTKSIAHYTISREDLAFNRRVTLADYQSGFAEEEYFTWGELNDTDVYDGLRKGEARMTTATLVSEKKGIWKTYDPSGKLRNRRLTEFENTIIVKQMMGKHGLPPEQAKQIYEKAKSLEALAQMFEDNIAGEDKNALLKYWREAGAVMLQTLNKPRSALGLPGLTFKE